MTDVLEGIYQQAIALVPRSNSEKPGGFLETDLIKEMVKHMTTGTGREKWLAAATLIEHKTNKGTTKPNEFIDLGGEPYLNEPERLMRWDGWLIEQKNMTVPWMDVPLRQGEEQKRQADAEYDRANAEHAEAMELFNGLPEEGLTIAKAANIKYRQGSELARKWLLDLNSPNYVLSCAMESAAVAAHPNWRETAKGHYEMVDKSLPDNNFDELVNWFQVTHPLQAREVHKAVLAELKATKEAIVNVLVSEQLMKAAWDEGNPDDPRKPDPDGMTDRALQLVAKAGHVIDRDRMYFLLTEFIRDWGPDDWKLDDDDDGPDDDPDPDEHDPSPIGGELVGA